MFSLIIVVLSILLAILLVFALFFYGGRELNNAGIQATVDTLVNQGAQIEGATVLYQNDRAGISPQSTTNLVSNGYLTNVPQNWSVTQSGVEIAYIAVNSPAVCIAFNAKYGINGVPSCRRSRA